LIRSKAKASNQQSREREGAKEFFHDVFSKVGSLPRVGVGNRGDYIAGLGRPNGPLISEEIQLL
jgi:hypothetical protein